jgi:hypothetical protein
MKDETKRKTKPFKRLFILARAEIICDYMEYFIPVDRAENLIPGDINRDENFNPGNFFHVIVKFILY